MQIICSICTLKHISWQFLSPWLVSQVHWPRSSLCRPPWRAMMSGPQGLCPLGDSVWPCYCKAVTPPSDKSGFCLPFTNFGEVRRVWSWTMAMKTPFWLKPKRAVHMDVERQSLEFCRDGKLAIQHGSCKRAGPVPKATRSMRSLWALVDQDSDQFNMYNCSTLI